MNKRYSTQRILLAPSDDFSRRVTRQNCPQLPAKVGKLERILWLLFLFYFVFIASSISHAASASLFDDANAKYQAGDFKSAAVLYESLIQSGHETASVQTNLGNARFRLKQKGKAMVAYERALHLNPRDADARWNREVLKSVLTDRLENGGENLIVFFIKKWIQFVTPDEMAWALAGFLGMLAAGAVLGFWFPRIRPLTSAVQVALILLFVCATPFFTFKWFEIKDPTIVVLDKEVTARYGPSERETPAFLLHEGAEAKATDFSRDWIYVTLANKNSGWIRKESCEII